MSEASRRAPLDPSQRPGPIPVEPQLGRGTVERGPLPGRSRGARPDRFAERTLQTRLTVAILICASVIVGQLWALTAALDAWLGRDVAAVGWLMAFQALSFGVCLLVWTATPKGR